MARIKLDRSRIISSNGLSVAVGKPTRTLYDPNGQFEHLCQGESVAVKINDRFAHDQDNIKTASGTVAMDKSKLLTTKGLSVAAGKPFVIAIDNSKLLTTKGLSTAVGKPPKDA